MAARRAPWSPGARPAVPGLSALPAPARGGGGGAAFESAAAIASGWPLSSAGVSRPLRMKVPATTASTTRVAATSGILLLGFMLSVYLVRSFLAPAGCAGSRRARPHDAVAGSPAATGPGYEKGCRSPGTLDDATGAGVRDQFAISSHQM